MLIIPPPKYRKNRGRLMPAPVPAGPVALTLVMASYDPNQEYLTLGFDRPINVDNYSGTAVRLADGDFSDVLYDGTGGIVGFIDPATVQITLNYLGQQFEPGVVLNVAGGSGIVAVDDGGTWAGVSGLVLPFGG